MARKAIVDKDIILSMLREGETTGRIAEKFKVSRQAIDVYRRDFIEKGFLPNQRASKSRREPKEATPKKKKRIIPGQSLLSRNVVSLDEHIDLMIDAFNALKRLPQLEKDFEKCRLQYENALLEIRRLKTIEQKRLDQESRWFLTQHQGKDAEYRIRPSSND